ncbi:prolipoprotein diacylglyceryl transferase [Roseinatronobacter monicus]|uniref:Phosphatidylglycerol--prolipoprotein diacylglyceryl transferase n=1 Tax=Roseinatronobacter monicus TaxID=393481 RepID=A0A543KDK9_9RHOB|nr:prolipoprotein diacylglyceryl transferase [Roseinatronobacter monicus]TQM93158.1 prolipoprotein diacylglyceryl transferase [Roseinatronobacter monicus]
MTPFAILFPDLSPEIFSISIGNFNFALRWYALAYIAGFIAGWWIIQRLMQRPALWPADTPPMEPAKVEALLTYVIIGVILGGRLGFVLFYQPGYYLANPTEILRVWEGGMSFHGGFGGVIVAGLIFCRRHAVPPLQIADAMALVAPIGIGLGRLSNFINAELWGRPTLQPWGVIFPGPQAQNCPWDWPAAACARHPTQLYEAALEGLVLFAVLAFVVWRRGWLKRPGLVTGTFVAGYGLARFTVEIWRQADAQFITPGNPLGHVISLGPMGLTMGQVLSLPMIAIGIGLLLWRRRA